MYTVYNFEIGYKKCHRNQRVTVTPQVVSRGGIYEVRVGDGAVTPFFSLPPPDNIIIT